MERNTPNRIIAITPEERNWLMRQFKVSNVTVWQAVKYKRNNDIHKRIRKAAIERGNPQMVLAPEFDTIFLYNRKDADDTQRYYMVQTFENGATLEACLDTGLVEIRDNNGRVAGQWKNPLMSYISVIQAKAQLL